MNKTKTPTYKKVMTTLRLEPELFNLMQQYVSSIKQGKRSYSINEYLTDLVENNLKENINENFSGK